MTGASAHAGEVTASPDPLDRRTLLRLGLVGGMAALVGCSPSTSGSARPSHDRGPELEPSRLDHRRAEPDVDRRQLTRGGLPAPAPWVAGAGEVHPEVKRRALRALETIGTWSTAGGGSAAAASARLRALGVDPALTAQARPLLGADRAAVTRVVDAQYGGILSSSSSVLAVLDQWRLDADGHVHASGTTVDVRLVAASPRWRITELRPGLARTGGIHVAGIGPSRAREHPGPASVRGPGRHRLRPGARLGARRAARPCQALRRRRQCRALRAPDLRLRDQPPQ